MGDAGWFGGGGVCIEDCAGGKLEGGREGGGGEVGGNLQGGIDNAEC